MYVQRNVKAKQIKLDVLNIASILALTLPSNAFIGSQWKIVTYVYAVNLLYSWHFTLCCGLSIVCVDGVWNIFGFGL